MEEKAGREKVVGADRSRRGFQAEECEKGLSQATDPGEGKRERSASDGLCMGGWAFLHHLLNVTGSGISLKHHIPLDSG